MEAWLLCVLLVSVHFTQHSAPHAAPAFVARHGCAGKALVDSIDTVEQSRCHLLTAPFEQWSSTALLKKSAVICSPPPSAMRSCTMSACIRTVSLLAGSALFHRSCILLVGAQSRSVRDSLLQMSPSSALLSTGQWSYRSTSAARWPSRRQCLSFLASTSRAVFLSAVIPEEHSRSTLFSFGSSLVVFLSRDVTARNVAQLLSVVPGRLPVCGGGSVRVPL